MALTEKIKLQGKAGLLKIDGYRQMTEAQLKVAIASAEKAAKASPAPVATNGTNGAKGKQAATAVVKGKAAVAAPSKGKAATTTAPPKGKTSAAPKGKAATTSTPAPAAKSTAQKSSPPKGKATAAQGKVERPAAGSTKGKAAAATPKGKTGAAAKPAARTRAPRNTGTVESFKATIDNSKVDWKAPSSVGTEGKRKDVLDNLRKFKGDKAKTFDALKDNAVKWYPNALNSFPNAPTKKHAAERMLVWLIGRVAYDFVKKTGQHQDGTRLAYGQSTDPKHVKRREARAGAPKVEPKGKPAATPARKPAASAPAKKPAARTPARGKTAPAAKGKAALRGVR